MYDNEDAVCGIVYNGTPYYFLKNLQGDIIAIADANGDTVARYTYDAWGVPTVAQDLTSVGIATINPFRYRGYYYDAEIGMYYLQSRYYDPIVGRFVNGDHVEFVEIPGLIYTAALFAYVHNDPVNNVDETGDFSLNSIFKIIGDIFSKIVSRIKSFFNSLFKIKDGKLYISTTVISVTIDTIIALIISKWASITIKGLLKVLVKLYFKKAGKKVFRLLKKY